MSDKQKFLYKGHQIKRGDKVKAVDGKSGAVNFYRVEQVWGSHLTMRVIPEEEGGPNPTVITVHREAWRAS